nr:MAG TPA: hypothetical protein [Caudoviricetes sp.]
MILLHFLLQSRYILCYILKNVTQKSYNVTFM